MKIEVGGFWRLNNGDKVLVIENNTDSYNYLCYNYSIEGLCTVPFGSVMHPWVDPVKMVTWYSPIMQDSDGARYSSRMWYRNCSDASNLNATDGIIIVAWQEKEMLG